MYSPYARGGNLTSGNIPTGRSRWMVTLTVVIEDDSERLRIAAHREDHESNIVERAIAGIAEMETKSMCRNLSKAVESLADQLGNLQN